MTGMKIGLIGGALGMLIGVAAMVLTLGIWGLVLGGGMAFLFYWIFKKAFGPIFEQSRILKTGESAPATILSVTDTNITINNQPVAKLKLKVMPRTLPAYETEVNTIVNRFQTSYFVPGVTLTVRFDPRNPKKVAVETVGTDNKTSSLPNISADNSSPQSTQQISSLENMLKEIEAANQKILSTGLSAQATIIRTWELGINVNGENPLTGFWLKISPEGSAPFEAEAKAIISQASLPKYQVGQTIYVKYDASDNTKVAIEHS